jgi:fibro-slime domain-containing protein
MNCATMTPAGCVQGAWVTADQGRYHNAWFTDEVHYYFVFTNSGVELQFYGDDDMYIFINGVLVLDLGAIHQRLPGKVTVDGTTGNAAVIEGGFLDAAGNITACPAPDPADPTNVKACTKPVAGDDCRTRAVPLGLKVGSTYEIAIFGADRGATESNYQLTLNAFSTNKTVCTPRCGDGVTSGGEECDCSDANSPTPDSCNGQKNDDNVYGGCTTKCKYGAYCGDGNTDTGEVCDAGTNNGATYITDKNSGGCSVTCQLPHFCGDKHVDTAFGEQCDLGDSNGQKILVNGKMCEVCDSSCQLITEC